MGAGAANFSSDPLRRAAVLLREGHHAEAALWLRRALDAGPDAVEVSCIVGQLLAVARTWLTLGQAGQALALLAPLAESERASGTTLMLYGHALIALGRVGEAETAFRRWVRNEPQNGQAALRLAAILADNDSSTEAEVISRNEIARHGDTPDAAYVLGRALLAQGRFDEAEAALRKVLSFKPEHQGAQANLMEVVWMRSGDVRESVRMLDDVLRARPELVGLRITKARLLLSACLSREALAVIESGLRICNRDAALLRAASTIALEFDGALALGYAQRLLQAAPGDRMARVEVGNALLATGDAANALRFAEALQQSDPADGRALAMRADALRMQGDQAYRSLLDYRDFVRAEQIETPEGWPSLTTYLLDLVRDLVQMHTLQAHPIGNSLRGGSQIQLHPEQSPLATVRAFPKAIDGPIRRYLQALGMGNDVMRSRNTDHYRISGIWSVRLRSNGFHVNHYHPGGWISSACYLHLPPAVERRGGEGWLQFGQPAFPTTPVLEPEYMLKPEPGLLALFPSYMWHGTVPFSGGEDDSRLTIAFDVVPAPSE